MTVKKEEEDEAFIEEEEGHGGPSRVMKMRKSEDVTTMRSVKKTDELED